MFIQTESTPNPNTLKFLPGRDVLGSSKLGRNGRDFASADVADASPLAVAIFATEGVTRVYLGDEFVSVTKTDDADWAHLKPFVLGAIMEHFVANRPVLLDAASAVADASEADDRVYEGEAAEIVDQIKELIDTRVRPAVAQDGGDITFHSWDHDAGVVKLHMKGACAGCPSSTMTLKQGIQNMLRHYVPEVRAVEQVI
ncbi:MAG: NifU family protein [Hyphomonadaceae bacterium]|nr:MAG: NifU domain-containing protein [Caulobacteraceae bacterium]MBT9444444.1 NifU family protein [Hyphomonadaceae bacterium]TPW06396.1 MAG: NifU domain-containing protein [Alphaproteobacteria bacterium]